MKKILHYMAAMFAIVFSTKAQAQTAPSLGAAQEFAVLASTSVTNVGSTLVYADLGTSEDVSTILGFPPGVVLGEIRRGGIEPKAADEDAQEAYNALAALTPTQNLSGQQLGKGFDQTPEAVLGTVLGPGVYRFDGDALLRGQLRLDGRGNPNSLFIFQVNGDFRVEDGSVMSVQNGAQPKNIYFQIAGNLVDANGELVGTAAALKGNMLVQNDITLSDGTTHEGRLLSLNGDVFLSNNTIFLPTITETDLAITKTVDRTVVAIGDTVTYTITVRNQGPDDATRVQVREVFPNEVAFIDYTSTLDGVATTFPYDASTGVFLIGDLDFGQTATIRIRARVLASGTDIRNRVTVIADQPDPDEDDDEDEEPIDVPDAVTDLQVVKTVDKTRANVGDQLTYTITVQNNGPEAATGVMVRDILPVGQIDFNGEGTASSGSYDMSTGVWTVGNLGSGATATFTITGTITATGTIVNTATVRGNEADQQPGNNTSTVVTVVPGTGGGGGDNLADLQVTKTVDRSRANPGQAITYTITARNAGPAAATGVTVTDMLPEGVTFGAVTVSNGSYNASTGIWTIGDLAAGSTATFTVTGTITATSGNIVNTAVIDGDQNDERPENNTSTVITIIVPEGTNPDDPDPTAATDLQVVKTVDKTRASVGDQITYTVTVRNNGPNPATNVLVVDVLPEAQANFGTPNVTGSGTYNPATGVWSVGNLAAGGTAVFTVTGTITSAGTIVNTAVVRGNEADPQPQNNTSTVITIVTEDNQQPGVLTDLQVTKTVDKTRANVGDAITYTVTATNNGPNNATGVILADRLPSGQVNFAGPAMVSSGTYNMSSGIWNIGNLASGQTVTLTVMGTITATGTIVNTATIGGNEADQQPDNNTSTVVTVVGPGTGGGGDNFADLQVRKTVDKIRAATGQTITYTITARNAGPAAATGVTVTDVLPTSQVTFGAVAVSNGSYNATTGVWTIGDLAANATATFTVTGTITDTDGNIFNTARIEGDQEDERPENNTSTVVTVITDGTDPNPADATDLQVVKTVDKTRANVGDPLTYTVTVRNNGPNAATNVLVVDVLPEMQADFGTPSVTGGGFYNGTTGMWVVGNLAAGETAVFTVTGTITSAGTIVNTAIVRGDEADPQPQNNTSTVITIVDGGTGPGALADLQITKTVDKTRATVGQPLFYVITARNNGPANATGVTVRDMLPIAQLNISGQPNVSTGTYSLTTGIWNIGNLASGQEVTMTVAGTITATGTIVNTATIGGNEADQNPANNTSTVVTVVGTGTGGGNLADLQVIKAVDKTRAATGQTLTYTITARNAGPNPASGVTVTDILPIAQLNIIGQPSVSAGSYNATTGIWTINDLGVGQSVVMRVTGTITATSGSIINTAVISGNQVDERPENNTSTVITIVTNGDVDPEMATDLQVVKTVDKTMATVGESLRYTITARNNGPNNATGVMILDILPPQLTIVGQPSTTRGAYDMATGIWTIGNLTAGQSVVMTVNSTINTAGTIVNTAVVTGNEADNQPQNNSSTVITIVGAGGGLANLNISKSTVGGVTEVTLGENITYTLRAANAGPGDATGVTVTDVLPNGLEFVSASPADAYNSTTGVWNIGNLLSGNARELTITAKTTMAGRVSNTAVVDGNEDDPDDDDNTDTEDTCVRPTAPIVGNTTVCAGNNATFTIESIAGVTSFEVTGLPEGVTRVAGGGNTVTLQVGASVATGVYSISFIAVNPNTNCANSVPSTATLTVSGRPATPGDITTSTTNVCSGVAVTFSVEPVPGATSYTWTYPAEWTLQGGAKGASITLVPTTNTPGEVTVTADNDCGPSTAATRTVTPGSTPVAPVIQDNAGPCAGLEYSITSPVNGEIYTWTAPVGFYFIDANNNNIGTTTTGTTVNLRSDNPTNAGTLSVTASSGGCGSSSATTEIEAAKGEGELFFPTVFTPNGDGVNDAWIIRNLENYPDNDLFIYNRWGNEVFRDRGYNNDWMADGLEEAVYFYVLRVRGCNGQEQTYRGWVQVVR